MRTYRRAAATLVLVAIAAAGCSFGTDDDDTTEVKSSDTTTSTESDDANETTDTTAPEEQPTGALELVMDASGSMNEADANGQPLIDGAKQALHGVVEALPDEIHAGLRVYGHRFPNTDKANGCTDSELISPVQALDRDALEGAIDGFEALGFTPIGYSLQEAAKDLPAEGPRSIVLVSDGEDTCAPPDPCEVADQLRADGIDLVIHTVGFALGGDQAARDQLSCIAQAGGGEFHDAADAASLATTLEDVSAREARRFVPEGDVLEGTPVPESTPTGEVDTAYTDTILGHEVNFYRFEVPANSTVRGEINVAGNPAADDDSLCATAYLTDEGDADYANSEFGGGPASETVTKYTEPAELEDVDEVWLKIETDGCSGRQGPDAEFQVELTVSTVD